MEKGILGVLLTLVGLICLISGTVVVYADGIPDMRQVSVFASLGAVLIISGIQLVRTSKDFTSAD
jgi:uncharacterized membrane protein